MHEHKHVHELRHCPICDIVYCEGCSTEWYRKATYTITSSTQPYKWEWTGGTITTEVPVYTHVHESTNVIG